MKRFIYFIISLIPWFISSILFSNNINFFDTLNLPWFALSKNLYGVAWTILYILIAVSISKIYINNNIKDIPSYNKTLISNYIFNQLYIFFMFSLENTFLGFVDSIVIFITALFLYYETKEIDERSSKFLLPYVFFSLYATILSVTIYFLNI